MPNIPCAAPIVNRPEGSRASFNVCVEIPPPNVTAGCEPAADAIVFTGSLGSTLCAPDEDGVKNLEL
jgi:hypothetical protein